MCVLKTQSTDLRIYQHHVRMPVLTPALTHIVGREIVENWSIEIFGVSLKHWSVDTGGIGPRKNASGKPHYCL